MTTSSPTVALVRSLGWIEAARVAVRLAFGGGGRPFAHLEPPSDSRERRSRAQAAVPADGHFVRVNGKRVHYRDEGSGPTIVMIHGLAGQMRNFSYALLDKLASDHRVILIDRPGSGYSDPIDSATMSVSMVFK